ncbi:MAG: PGPGW domain-containing protein [Rhizobiaceae bacterium]
MLSRLPTPSTKLGRTLLGVLLIIGGILGFLPVLGFWMIPLGLLILSQDFASVRRFRRRWTVKISRWWDGVKARRKARAKN